MKKIMQIIVSIIALTVMAPGQAEEAVVQQNFYTKVEAIQVQSTIDKMVTDTRDKLDSLVQFVTTPWIDFSVSSKDEDCLARNIFYEAGSESEEGKAAVAIVTINRVKDGRFGNSICGVVNQRTVYVRQQTLKKTEMVQTGWFGRPEEVTRHEVQIQHVPVCQFSWVCAIMRKPGDRDERWTESQRIAREVLKENYAEYRAKFDGALYFHSAGIRPVWAPGKKFVARVGGHMFYGEKPKS
jgi:spore germination cell wall hydrolase CwlJ-like protein